MRQAPRFVRRRPVLLMMVAAFAVAAFQAGPAFGQTEAGCPRDDVTAPQIAECELTVTATQVTATFTIAGGFSDVEVSLASYTKPPPEFEVTYPQFLFDSETGFFDEGQHTLTVDLPPCGFWQVDLALGPVLLTIPDRDSGYVAQDRRLDAALGENGECDEAQTLTPGFWKNHASCSGSNGNQDFVLDEVLAELGTIRIGDVEVDTCEEAVALLDHRTIGNGDNMADNAFFKLARNLLAARLNTAGTLACGEVTAAMAEAQALLAAVDFNGVDAPTATEEQTQRAGELATLLDDYNNGLVCP